MSRCFPYPPPGYCRKGATYESLIESIKLQKETDKAKSERKKEKRAAKKEKKEKKLKEKRNNEEKSKLQKDPTGYQQQYPQKLLQHQKAADSKEAHDIMTTMPSSELFEKSDLTEEHGQPISSSHQPSYSSDSTQNSNKRKRDDTANLSGGSTGHGKPIKIRLLKKHKVSDSSKETLCSNSGRTDLSSLSGADARLNSVPSVPSSSNSDRNMVSVRKSGVPATSGREDNAVQGILLTQINLGPSSVRPVTQINDPTGLRLAKNQSASSSARPFPPKDPVSSGLKHGDVGMLQSSRQQPIASFRRVVVPQSQVSHEMPSSSMIVPPGPSVSRETGVQGLEYGRQQQESAHLKRGPSDLVKTTGKRPISERPISEIPAPSHIGPVGPKKAKDPRKVKPTRLEKKMRKNHDKYEKLIGSWVPPVFQALLPDVNDGEDWLLRRTKTAKASSSMGDIETCRELGAKSLWQPCARLLAEVDIHALPYTVPF